MGHGPALGNSPFATWVSEAMSWIENFSLLGWMLALGGLMIGLFVLWDLIFCGGERCREFLDRIRDRRR